MSSTWSNIIGNVKTEKLLGVSNLIIMTVTFLLLGFFIDVVVMSQTAMKYLEDQAQITIFFKDDFSEENILKLKENILTNPKISDVKYVSKEDAFNLFKEVNKDEPVLLESITPNVLPASLEVKAKNIRDLASLTADYRKIDGVEEVRYFEDVVNRFRAWSTSIYVFGGVLVTLFLVISFSVVVTTLRTTIASKGKEFETMKLVGAPDSYVKKPLVYQGVFYGIFSSAIASVLMILIGFGISQLNVFSKGLTLGFLHGVYLHPLVESILLSVILVSCGWALGYFGSKTAIEKYLKY